MRENAGAAVAHAYICSSLCSNLESRRIDTGNRRQDNLRRRVWVVNHTESSLRAGASIEARRTITLFGRIQQPPLHVVGSTLLWG